MVKKFYAFLFIQGFMPSFMDYDYYFAIDVMHISLFAIGLGTCLIGIVVVVGPLLY